MDTAFARLGIDELYRRLEAAELHNDTNMIEAIHKELDTRDIDGYNERLKEAQLGA